MRRVYLLTWLYLHLFSCSHHASTIRIARTAKMEIRSRQDGAIVPVVHVMRCGCSVF
jgi:hypothetical protein